MPEFWKPPTVKWGQICLSTGNFEQSKGNNFNEIAVKSGYLDGQCIISTHSSDNKFVTIFAGLTAAISFGGKPKLLSKFLMKEISLTAFDALHFLPEIGSRGVFPWKQIKFHITRAQINFRISEITVSLENVGFTSQGVWHPDIRESQ